VKKKYSVSLKDKKDWKSFTSQISNISNKDEDFLGENQHSNRVSKLDLHGYSLDDANKEVERFITESFNKNYKKLLIVTGKGSRSKSYHNPYISENLGVLKNSVPEYINNNENLNSMIKKIDKADHKDGGEGAITLFLKSNKKFTK